jgi:hypothetical protein
MDNGGKIKFNTMELGNIYTILLLLLLWMSLVI